MSDFLVFKEKYPFLSEYFPFFDIFKSKSSILGVARWGGRPVVKRVNVSLFLRPYPYAHICSYMLSGRIFSPQAPGPDPYPPKVASHAHSLQIYGNQIIRSSSRRRWCKFFKLSFLWFNKFYLNSSFRNCPNYFTRLLDLILQPTFFQPHTTP